MELDDFLDAFNWIDRIQGFAASLIHADWKKAVTGAPVIGLASELVRGATGASSWTFHVPRDSGWTGGDVESLLGHYAIVVWGRRITGRHYILSVKSRQANWAEYLILRRGIPLDGSLFNPANAQYAKKYAPGDRPPAWADRDHGHGGPIDKLAAWL